MNLSAVTGEYKRENGISWFIAAACPKFQAVIVAAVVTQATTNNQLSRSIGRLDGMGTHLSSNCTR